MTTILGLDLGKFKSVACLYDPATSAARFATVHTDPAGLREFLQAERPGLVVFETCTVAGWVADLCSELGLELIVADPMHEAGPWNNFKRKTDSDEALELARSAAMGDSRSSPCRPARPAGTATASTAAPPRRSTGSASCRRCGGLPPSGNRTPSDRGDGDRGRAAGCQAANRRRSEMVFPGRRRGRPGARVVAVGALETRREARPDRPGGRRRPMILPYSRGGSPRRKATRPSIFAPAPRRGSARIPG
jgi:hypothetical protein